MPRMGTSAKKKKKPTVTGEADASEPERADTFAADMNEALADMGQLLGTLGDHNARFEHIVKALWAELFDDMPDLLERPGLTARMQPDVGGICNGVLRSVVTHADLLEGLVSGVAESEDLLEALASRLGVNVESPGDAQGEG